MATKEKGKHVGPSPERAFRNPFDGGYDSQSGSMTEKTIDSPSDTVTGCGIPAKGGYDNLWEGK